MEYPRFVFGDIFKRILAYIIDVAMIDAITKPILGVLGLAASGEFLSIYSLLRLGIYLAYFVLATGLTGGYTIGRAITGLRVVRMDGEELDWPTVLTRELIMGFVQYKWMWLAVIIPFNEYRQSLGDMLAETGMLSEKYLEDLESIQGSSDHQISMEEL